MRTFLKGFVYAFNGIIALVGNERNFRVHLLVLALVVCAGIFFSISPLEWLIIVLIASVVLGLEALNTAIEKLCDLYSTSWNEQIRLIKDVAAGAVLISAIGAIVIGLIIFWPYLAAYFEG